MRYSIIKHNKNGNYDLSYDGYVNHHWFKPLSTLWEYTTDHESADVSILPIGWEPNYEFDNELLNINFNNIVILDFLEFGCGTWWDKRYQNEFYSLFGIKVESYDNFFGREPAFEILHAALKNKLHDKIRIYFKRELSNQINTSNFSIPVLPVDFINTYDAYTPVSEEEFYGRGLDLLYIWGRSSQDRVKLYAQILYQMDRFGHNMYTSEKQYDEEFIKNNRDRGIALFHKEWYERCDFRKYQKNSRCVIDLYGAGLKCFRTIESTIDAISFKQDLSFLSHAYPWVDGENCIMLPNQPDKNNLDVDAACDKIWEYIRGSKQSELYPIYLNSCETNMKYINTNYLQNYFIPNINMRLV